MSKIRQLFADSAKKIKVYPRSIAKAVDVHGGGTVQDYIDGARKIKKAEQADSTSNVPWNGVTNKPSTYPPSTHSHTKSQISDFPSSLPANGGHANTADNATMSATSEYAYVADKIRTFDRNNVWHNDRLFYVHEIADGVYEAYVQEANRACPVKAKYAENADNVQGYYPLHVIGSYNPAGNDWVVVPCLGRDVQYASILNGNWDACPIRCTSAARQGDHLLVFFERAFTGNIQLNIRMFYPS